MKVIQIKAPYLIFLGSETRLVFAKTGAGLVEWRRDLCAGQIRLTADTVDLGLPDMSLTAAKEAGVQSIIIGTACVGGALPDDWVACLSKAASMGFDIVAGIHERLADNQVLSAAAQASGAGLIDIRVPPETLPVGKGDKRQGKRLLMVGTDCAVGKKYTALQIEKDMQQQGWHADFRASGQTGIMIAGQGIPIDSVISDFVSGAAELLSPDNTPDHWDVIEGQGGIFHPGYSAVSLGLLIGSQPDAFVVCHEAGRDKIAGWPHFATPSLQAVIDRTIALGRQVNPAIHCVGVSVNTSHMSDAERTDYLSALTAKMGVPCVDPLKTGTGPILDQIKHTEV